MTKKEMVYDILSKTTLTGVNPKEVDAKIRRNTKAKVQELWQQVEEDNSKALVMYDRL